MRNPQMGSSIDKNSVKNLKKREMIIDDRVGYTKLEGTRDKWLKIVMVVKKRIVPPEKKDIFKCNLL